MEFFLETLKRNLALYKNRTAFHIEGENATYGQLSKRISSIQQAILQHPAEHYFGVVARNTLDTYAAIFALWLSGKTSVPLSPKTPAERNKYILNQVGIATIFDAGTKGLEFQEATTITTGALVASDHRITFARVSPETNLYLLFTSGSTGMPKGVQINRENLQANYEAFFKQVYAFTAADRCLQVYDLTFDASVQCYTFPLLAGASVFTVPEEGLKFLAIPKIAQEHRLTFVKMTPSAIYYLQPYFDRIHLPDVKACVFGAEGLPAELIRKWEKCVPNARVLNVYGPTEVTINCTVYEWDRTAENKTINGVVAIGKVFSNTKVLIVDEQKNSVTEGTKGELCLSGNQVTKGYWMDPLNNGNAFFERDGERFYRTGDLVHRDHEGDIFYLGRIDSQVKIDGHRIELSEIENHSIQFTGVKCVAMAQQSNELAHAIYLFVESTQVSVDGLLQHLRTYLPEYMIPAKVHLLEQMPLLPSGKTDRQQLTKMLDHA